MSKIFYLDRETVLNVDMIKKYIEVFKSTQLPRLEKLKRYYDTKNDAITNRTFTDTSLPNNKIATSWADYISNITSAYFIGKPVVYNSANTDMLNEINMIFKYNDEQTKNNTLALNQSIYGIAEELLYIDNGSNTRFAVVDPRQVILIYENTLEENLLYAIRFYSTENVLTNEKTLFVEVYTADKIYYYKEIAEGGLILIDEKEHYFNGVPVNPYKNNPDCMGDFEKLIKLIDAYDFAMSDSQNERDNFNDSYMRFINTGLDETSIVEMKETKNIIVDGVQDGIQPNVDFLIKNGNPTETETNKQRIENDIHKFSYVNNMAADAQKSHTSATGAKLSMLGLEQTIAIKEAYFKYGLQRRIELLTNILNLKGADYDYRSITMSFTRNIPQDIGVTADTISKLRGLVSDETLMELLPFITDVEQEKKRLEAQNALNSYADLFNSDAGVDTVE